VVEGQAALHKLVLSEGKDRVVRPAGGALGKICVITSSSCSVLWEGKVGQVGQWEGKREGS
jgi:hypothetical protein